MSVSFIILKDLYIIRGKEYEHKEQNNEEILGCIYFSNDALTGCSTPSNQENAPAKEPVKEEKVQSETTATEEVKEELSKTEQAKAELDFGGETIVFCYPPGYGMIDTTGTSVPLARRDARIEELEEKYNVNIEQRDDASTYWENMVDKYCFRSTRRSYHGQKSHKKDNYYHGLKQEL